MAKPRLYIETTIPSYLTARPSKDLRLAADQQTTREWWENQRHEYDLFISAAVLDETADGDAAFAANLKCLMVFRSWPRQRLPAPSLRACSMNKLFRQSQRQMQCTWP